MEKKGITKKQFWIQMFPAALYVLLAVFWIVSGIQEKDNIHLVFGAVFLALSVTMLVSLLIQRKRHLIEDAQADAEASRNFKDGMKGMGIVYAIIALGFLLAFGLAWILS